MKDENGNRVIDFQKSNLHVLGYSVPVDKWITLSEIQEHLHSLPEQPNAIPYITSYYKERWGFVYTPIILCKNTNRQSSEKEVHNIQFSTYCDQICSGMSVYKETLGIFLCKNTNRQSFDN